MNNIYVGIFTCHFILLFVAELWPLIDVRNSFSAQYLKNFLQHEKRCSGAIVRFSDNSSSTRMSIRMDRVLTRSKIMYMWMYYV